MKARCASCHAHALRGYSGAAHRENWQQQLRDAGLAARGFAAGRGSWGEDPVAGELVQVLVSQEEKNVTPARWRSALASIM
jgi:hypothetical protein